MALPVLPERRKRSRGLADLPPERVKNAMFDTLMAAAPVSVTFWDPQLRLMHTSPRDPSWAPAREPVGRGFRSLVASGGLGAYESQLRSVLETGRAVLGVEITGLWPGQEDRIHVVGFYPVNGRAGERLGVAVVGREVRARRQLRSDAETQLEAFDRNDDVVQGLVVALMAMELGEYQQAQVALRATLGTARTIIGDLVAAPAADILPGPGRYRRRRPAAQVLQAGE